MKKNSTKLLILILFFAFGFIFMPNAKADDWMTLCKYTFNSGSEAKRGYSEYAFKSYIRYNKLTKEYRISVFGYNNDNNFNENHEDDTPIFETNHWNSLFSYLDEDDNTFAMSKDEQSDLRENGVCPSKLYYDTDWPQQLCYSSGSYCEGEGKPWDWNATMDLNYSISKNSDKLKEYQDSKPSNFSKAEKMCDYGNNAWLGYNSENGFTYFTAEDIDSVYGNFDSIISFLYDGSGGVDNYISAGALEDLKNNKCPKYLFLDYDAYNEACFDNEENGYCKKRTGDTFKGDKLLELKKQYDDILKKFNKTQKDKNKVDRDDCKGILSEDLVNWLQKILNIFKIVAPLLVLALTIYDFVMATVNSDADALKKKGNLFIKRLMMMFLLYFTPTLINMVLSMLAIDSGTCNIK